jgi:uncharacterized protein (DUF488 family)
MKSEAKTLVALTIGHSTRTIEEFVRLLHAHAGTRVVDVRTVPRSRHNPQFNRDTLPDSLKSVCVARLAILPALHRDPFDRTGDILESNPGSETTRSKDENQTSSLSATGAASAASV